MGLGCRAPPSAWRLIQLANWFDLSLSIHFEKRFPRKCDARDDRRRIVVCRAGDLAHDVFRDHEGRRDEDHSRYPQKIPQAAQLGPFVLVILGICLGSIRRRPICCHSRPRAAVISAKTTLRRKPVRPTRPCAQRQPTPAEPLRHLLRQTYIGILQSPSRGWNAAARARFKWAAFLLLASVPRSRSRTR